MGYYIGIDVGGTYIKSAVVDTNGNIINNDLFIDESYAKESKNIILRNFENIIKRNIDSLDLRVIEGIGIAFPGPFDYEKGISKICNIDKYDSIYNVNIKDYLTNYMNENFNDRLGCKFDIKFANDATMFALGEYMKQNCYFNKVFSLCIGTGAGSAYIENGHAVKYKNEYISNGWIYNVPFKESIIDDYISSRGILNLAREKNIFVKDVKEIAQLALQGNINALEVWSEFEHNVYNVLKLVTKDYKPELVIIGGQISKSNKLFLNRSIEYFKNQGIEIIISENTSRSTLIGAKMLF